MTTEYDDCVNELVEKGWKESQAHAICRNSNKNEIQRQERVKDKIRKPKKNKKQTSRK